MHHCLGLTANDVNRIILHCTAKHVEVRENIAYFAYPAIPSHENVRYITVFYEH
jgi:hypothetical protein